ncbi:uncharacterized protein Dmul_34420 [Desulfococcus multivorans]|nr:uncharacterized protein Dmul_34420 [Desulfococcus multivorans]
MGEVAHGRPPPTSPASTPGRFFKYATLDFHDVDRIEVPGGYGLRPSAALEQNRAGRGPYPPGTGL